VLAGGSYLYDDRGRSEARKHQVHRQHEVECHALFDDLCTAEFDPTQRVVAHGLLKVLRGAAAGDRDALAFIYDDPVPGSRHRVPFDALCAFVRLDAFALISAIEKQLIPQRVDNRSHRNAGV